MVAFRTLDENGDNTFGKGLNNYSRDNEAIKLDVKTRINSWLGDCFFAMNDGIDWSNRLGSKNQREILEADLRKIITKTEGVTEITEFSSNLDDRNFSARYTISTIFSESFSDLVQRTL